MRSLALKVVPLIIGDKLIALHIFEGNLDGEMYRDFLNNKLQLHDDVTLEVRQNKRFQHNGCPAHYSIVARGVPDHDFHGHWIGRAGPINWLAR
ncbi:hypothetical protein Trydic_g11450 [Trypoxylus dichotomus]